MKLNEFNTKLKNLSFTEHLLDPKTLCWSEKSSHQLMKGSFGWKFGGRFKQTNKQTLIG